MLTRHFTGYKFGYELLMLNGLLTWAGMWMTGRKKEELRIKN
jgi:SSS family solute:Na+ symporter